MGRSLLKVLEIYIRCESPFPHPGVLAVLCVCSFFSPSVILQLLNSDMDAGRLDGLP